MPFSTKKIPINGKLNKDTDLSKVPDGDRLDAKNTSFISDDTNTEQSVQIVKGNTLSYTIPNTVAQNKTVRFYFSAGSLTDTQTISFLNQNGGVFATTTFSYGATANATMLNALGSCLVALATFGVPSSHTQGNDYFDLTLTPVGIIGADWLVQRTSTDATDTLIYTVLQEAISIDLAGEHHIISKNTQIDVRFEWSTTQVNLPQLIPFATFINIVYSNNGSNSIRVTTLANHNLVTGQVIQISSAPAVTNANGVWSVNVISPTQFDLVYSIFNLIGAGGDITINVQGFGQIGVVEHDINTNVWTYTRLIASKEFNFVRSKQIDNHVEYAGGRWSTYFTDDYNVIRCFYYDGAFITDGAISTVNPLGIYQYGSIGIETTLLLSSTNVRFNFVQQLQSGGQVPSGNNRYTICFLTENLTKTSYLDLCNPINTFSASTTGSAAALIGDDAGVLTPKVNQFEVTGIIPGLFKYVELVRVNYLGTLTISTKTVTRELLSGDSITLYDRGDNSGTTDLDATELLVQPSNYLTAKNIRAIDNRLIISNLTTAASKDFSAWFESFEHGLFVHNEPTVGSAVGTLTVNEYQLPDNVYNVVGYMHNEVYRFGGKVRFKNGAFSATFWIDDIIFNTSATNNSGVSNPNRRFAALPDYNLTDLNDTVINIAYVKFANINFDFLIDGVPVRNLIDELIIERVELDSLTTEILATGVVVIGVSGSLEYSFNTSPITKSYLFCGNTIGNNIQPPTLRTDYPFASDGSRLFWQTVGTPNIFPNEQITQTSAGVLGQRDLKFVAHRNVGSFYSPDIFLGSGSITWRATDQILNYGAQERSSGVAGQSAGGTFFTTGTYIEYSGYNYGVPPVSCTLLDTKYASRFTGVTLNDGSSYYKWIRYFDPVSATPNRLFDTASSYVVLTDPTTPINNTVGIWDNGIYYNQYYRNLNGSLKFGNTVNSKYVPCGTSVIVNSNTPNIATANAISVFGGDTFTQRTYLKLRYPQSASDGFGSGIGFYSQNKTNTQMRRKNTVSSPSLFPNITIPAWLGDVANEQLYYNHGYDIQNNVNSDVAFDVNARQVTDLPTRVAWSDSKPIGSVIDFFRYFQPLDFKDLDNTQGEIMHHDNVNGELVTWQLRSLQRQYFNSTGKLETNAGDIVIGDGSVMARDGSRITGYGTQNKWSVIKGKSKSGDDFFAWINIETRTIQSYGLNGVNVLSKTKDMNSFFNKDIKWAGQYDTPADGKGICGGWYEKNGQIYWTFMGERIVADWVQPVTGGYSIGNVVKYSPATYSTFNKTGEFYRSRINNNQSVPTNTTDWELIPHTDTEYYNEYTLAFTNYKDFYIFSEFFSFLPKIYLEWGNTFHTPRPISNTGQVYLHWEGGYGVWYDNGVTRQQEDGYIELIFNSDVDLIKHFLAVLVSSEIAPFKIEFRTKNHIATINAADFEAEIDQYQGGIPADQTVPSNQDGSALWGQYVRIKIYFQSETYQKLNSFVLKYFAQPRTYNK